MSKPRIRVIALCVIWRDGDLLVFEGQDTVKGETFYRPLGGGIEFGETGAAAAARELSEEISAAVTGLRYLGTLENIFRYQGAAGHELVRLYEAAFSDRSLYAREEFVIDEGGFTCTATWQPAAAFRDGRLILYPDGLMDLLDGRGVPG